MEKPLFINVYSGFYRIIVINSGNAGCIGEFGRHIFLSLESAAKVRDNSMYRGKEIPLYCSKCGGVISDWFDCTVCEYPSDYCEVDTLC